MSSPPLRQDAGVFASKRAFWPALFKAADWLALPAMLGLLGLFAYPIAMVLVYSFSRHVQGEFPLLEFTFENFFALFTTPVYMSVLLRTLKIGVITTLCCFVMGFPVAAAMAFSGPLMRRVLLIAVVCPILISAIVRTYGWVLILGLDGPLNGLLLSAGIVARPVKLLFNEFGVVVGLVHVYLPFMVLPLASVLEKIDRRLIEAARVMGAGETSVFLRVILPLSFPGIAAGVTLVFTLTVGALVTPVLLGGAAFNLLAPLIAQKMLIEVNWPMGSALSVLLIVITVLVLVLSGATSTRRHARLRARQ